MMEKLKKEPIELWFGLVAGIASIVMKDNTLLVMSIIFLTTAKILSEMKRK